MLRPEDCKQGALIEAIRDDIPVNPWHAAHVPPIGSLWTIREFVAYVGVGKSGYLAIILNEMPPHPSYRDFRTHWDLERFRLVPDSRLDVFRQIVRDAERLAEAYPLAFLAALTPSA